MCGGSAVHPRPLRPGAAGGPPGDVRENVLRAVEARVEATEELLARVGGAEAEKLTSTLFHSIDVPKISVRDFFARLRKYMCASEECYVVALIFIDRLVDRNAGLYVDARSVHRLLALAVVLAVKSREDGIYTNLYYSRVTGISLACFCALEQELLRALDFELFVTQSQYRFYVAALNAEDYGCRTTRRIIPVFDRPSLCFHRPTKASSEATAAR